MKNLRESKLHQTQRFTVGVHQQILKPQKSQSSYKGAIDASNDLKSRTIKSSLNKTCDKTSCAADAKAKSVSLPRDTDGEISRMLCSLLWKQSVPDVDIQTFAGDPLEYHSFMSSFREVVECKTDDPHGRLVQLLKFTDEEPKETIRHCIQQPSEIRHRLAKSLLEDHYGNPHQILAAYRKEIKSWTLLKPEDSIAYSKFYNFSIKCGSIMSCQQWNSLHTRCTLQFGIKTSRKYEGQVEQEGIYVKKAPTTRTRTLR